MDKESQKALKGLAIVCNALWIIIIIPMSLFMAPDPFSFAILFIAVVIAIPIISIIAIRKYHVAFARKIAIIINIFGTMILLYGFYAAKTYEYAQPPKGMNFIELGSNFSFMGALITIFNIVVFVFIAKKTNN